VRTDGPECDGLLEILRVPGGSYGSHLINESSLKVVDVDGIHWAATSVGHLLSLSQIVDIRVSFMNVGMICHSASFFLRD
jgi:hypothetical protein